MLYPPLKYILTGKLTTLTCPPENRLDLVPVDYVARAVTHLTLHSESKSGMIFHLTAGRDRSISIGEIVERALSLAGNTKTNLPVTYADTVDSAVRGVPEANRKIAALTNLYSSYLQVERDFDDTNTRTALQNSGIQLPDLRGYMDTLLKAFIAQETVCSRPAPVAAAGGKR